MPTASYPAAWAPRRPEASLTLETPEVRAAGPQRAALAAPTHAHLGDCLGHPFPGWPGRPNLWSRGPPRSDNESVSRAVAVYDTDRLIGLRVNVKKARESLGCPHHEG